MERKEGREMEFLLAIVGVIIFICVLAVAHFAQKGHQEMAKLNAKVDELIEVVKKR
jgi:hypothetical protein